MIIKLKEAEEAYYELSGTASTVSRQLSFAGIAVIWLFCTLDIGKIIVPNELILPIILIVISLGCDLLHYVVGSFIWGVFHRKKEKENFKSESEVETSRFLNWPALFFYWAKIVSIIIAYLLILIFLSSRILNVE